MTTAARHVWCSLRPVAWSVAWGYLSMRVGLALGWTLIAVIGFGCLVNVAAYGMAYRRSLGWRIAMLRHRRRLGMPLVIDEDGRLHAPMLMPMESLCVLGDEDGPIEAHVHSRHLFTGAPRLRAVTRWREMPGGR